MTNKEQIIDCEKKLLLALKYSNINVLDELLHDDLVFTIPTGQTLTKSKEMENYQSGVMTVSEIWASDQIIQSFGDTITVGVTIYLKGKFEAQIIDGKYRYLRVWKLFENTWKVIAGSGVSIQ
jgi:hypothetical protein